MAYRREESKAALRSQRRFLILMSLVVAAYYALAVHLKGDGEYSGLAVTIGRPDRIPIALWIIFTWAFLRYVQRLHEQWHWVGKAVMREFERCDHQLVLEVARRWAVREVKSGRIGKTLTNPYVVGDVQVTDTVKQMLRERMAQRAQAQGQPAPPFEPDPWFSIDKGGVRVYRGFAIGLATADHPDSVVGQDFMIPPWSRLRTLWHQLRAWARASLRLPAIFEHLAPLLIALTAVVIAVTFHVSSCL